MLSNQREKEKKVFDSVLRYQKEQNMNKSAAVRQTQNDFGYVTEAAVWGILRREGKRRKEADDGDRPA